MKIDNNNTDFLDLYGDIFDVIELEENPTFELISSYMPKGSELKRSFSFKGRKIEAYRKFIIQKCELKSQYLHVIIEVKKYSDGRNRYEHYREDKKGNYIFVNYLEY